jgi:hypothetical protein
MREEVRAEISPRLLGRFLTPAEAQARIARSKADLVGAGIGGIARGVVAVGRHRLSLPSCAAAIERPSRANVRA